jgi:signal transduction histidine kinase
VRGLVRSWVARLSTRRVAYGVALGLIGLCVFVTLVEVGTPSASVNGLIPVPAVLAALMVRPDLRATVLAVGTGVLATFMDPAAPWLWLGLVGMTFLAVAEDAEPRPWRGWVLGTVGSVVSLFTYSDATGLPFVAVALGGGAATLLRLRGHAQGLEVQTRRLQTQAVWLEQRTALARELHDVVGHHVTAMVVQAEAGQLGDRDQALRTIADVGRSALQDLDALVVNLRDPDAPLNVSAAPRLGDIDELLAEPLRQQGVEVAVRVDDDPGLDEVQALTVYRIAQEALTNIVKHARAAHAWVEVRRDGDRVRLRVSDDGVGPPGADHVGGSGLIGIGERVLSLGGSWDLSERPGGGTMLDVRVPVAG